jgi:dipeptidyl aminopeptidase/acylaminoacyl peptidase
MKNSETLYRLAGEPKRLIIQTNGDHRISDPEHQAEFIRESSEWFKRCFGL